MSIIVNCYNKDIVFKTRKQAKNYFIECCYGSEGAEKERYMNILLELLTTNKTYIKG